MREMEDRKRMRRRHSIQMKVAFKSRLLERRKASISKKRQKGREGNKRRR